MKNFKVEFVEEIPEDVEEKMRSGFVEYETSHGIDVNFKRFSFFIKYFTDEIQTQGILQN